MIFIAPVFMKYDEHPTSPQVQFNVYNTPCVTYFELNLRWTKKHCYMTASKVLLPLTENACNSFVQNLMIDHDAKFNSLESEKSDVRNSKTIFSCQTALTKVMSTCPQLIFVVLKKHNLMSVQRCMIIRLCHL